jgi:hypothetical protein
MSNDEKTEIKYSSISDEHKFKSHPNKKFLASFIGSLETNDIRQKMFESLRSMDGFKISKPQKYFNQYFYKKNMLNAHFALCPRGYGPATFRLYEAIQMKLIPIYISDVFWLPFTNDIEWDKMCLLIKEDEIETIPEKVNALLESEEHQNMIDYGQEIYRKHLTWDGCLNTISQKI